MNISRGAVHPLLLILLVATIAVSAAWWIETNKVPATTAPPSTGQSSAAATDTNMLVGPANGPAPLSVTFALRRDLGTVQTIDYGDGTVGVVTDFICGLTYCTRVHVYNKTGTYTGAFEGATGKPLKTFVITVTRGKPSGIY